MLVVLFTVLFMVLPVVVPVVVLGRQTSARPDGTAVAGEGAVGKFGMRMGLTGPTVVILVDTVEM